ncbi:hypothetical protein LOTGIDRAFT_205644 [Lottia gigantea]|uniref:RCR-type E3 ubiquitin transferase n=1 Tax=Lottia gigantea TaxID=225164 RepID=V4AJP0_LOTGI|nr:hypothetical protein LOTGIDRAFT_205644 [Lottia gigantea]ESO93791.1 hypothetical protein LOTGIDRAFT_205644 [Lottia gigantea]
MQALEGNLPFCWQSNERAFLKDFVACTPGTSGGRLARWLQPDSYLDPKQCEIVCNKEELKCSWPAVITIMNKDQYGQLVNVPNLKVEVKAVPVDMKDGLGDDSKKMRRLSRPDDGDLTFGGLPTPVLDVPYEPVVKDRRDIFHSITMMKCYENYSFEELRFAAPAVPRPSENMLVRANLDGTYSANWTPGCVGFYNIHVTIDGFETGDVYKVEVKEPPQGVTPPPQSIKKHHQPSRVSTLNLSSHHHPSRMRKFVAKYSAGLRIRIHPTLQSEQCGVIKPDGIISFIDEIHNDDGVWVRLSPDSIKDWCDNGYVEAWCVQYNQHLGKTLLVPVDEPKSVLDMKEPMIREYTEPRSKPTKGPRGPGVYQCINCGSYGHNIRTRPNLKATAIGMVTLGEKLVAIDEVINQDGVWVKLDPESKDNYCFNKESEAWSLVCNVSGTAFLQHESDIADSDPFSFNTLPQTVQRGFDFSAAQGESRFNGNGPTPNPSPPGSPKVSSRSSSPKLKTDSGGSTRSQSPSVRGESTGKEETFKTPPSSPLPIKVNKPKLHREDSFERISKSPSASPPSVKKSIRKDEDSKDSSSIGSGLLRPDDKGSSVDGVQTGSPSVKFTAIPKTVSPHRTRSRSPKQLSASSSRSNSPSIPGTFNIGTDDPVRLSPKAARKDRGRQLRSKRERAASPSPRDTTPVGINRGQASSSASIIHDQLREPVHEALSPSVAECMRAVFAAFMWHEGIVHDAMACASCLKFHPDLSKEMSKTKIKKEEKPRTRHLTDSSKDKKERKKENINESRKEDISDDSQLPPTLQHLVYFWEDLAGAVLKVVKQDIVVPSPALMNREKKVVEKKDRNKDKESKSKKRKEGKARGKGMFGEDVARLFGAQGPGNGGGGEKESVCELCDFSFSHPVTYHMRQAHPGCGRHACGKGYNSGGNFCGGWAGNCGEGGIGGSSWYLMCDQCRDKYLKEKRQSQKEKEREKTKKVKKKTTVMKPTSTLVTHLDVHTVLKNNAMFLLDLASASGFTLPKNIKKNGHSRSDIYLPSVSENLSTESEPFPPIPYMSNLKTPGHSPQPKSAGTSPDSEAGKKIFHRSISEMSTDDENGANHERNRMVTPRRRNNSGGVGDGGMSLLKHPSAAMTKLILSLDSTTDFGEMRLRRPVLDFIIQRHDLDGLQWAMRQALRKAACRVFALQAFNWLLRSVIQPSCIHDLLWFFVASLMPSPVEEDEEEDKDGKEGKDKDLKEIKDPREIALKNLMKRDQEENPLCDHPIEDIALAGKAVAPLPEVFHTFLQSISDIMMHLPSGSALQRMGVCCYSIKFQQSDHQFLHESHVFSNISRILTRSEEDNDDNSIDFSQVQVGFRVSCLKDITSQTDMKASSRQAMIGSLNDNTTETFWESGEEDRNRLKSLTLDCSNKTEPYAIYVHIDNSRDIQNKVGNITFSAGVGVEDIHKLKSVDLESRHIGWICCSIPDSNYRHIQLELKGPDQSLRVRQVKILGTIEDEDINLPVKKNALDLQQDFCEAETLRVFRNLTSQVFDKLIFNDQESDAIDGDNDLKEHMVGILFSRSKFSHLQKQVCSHIVQGFRKETARIREEWEHSLTNREDKLEENRASDVYCFELLSMVLALSGSTVGRNYLSQQHGLIQALFSLLHTATPRIQRQVISVLRRVLPDIKPQALASILSIPALPPVDYSIISAGNRDEERYADFDPETPGILDVFLACISKALTVQTKVKTVGPSKGLTTHTLAENIASDKYSRWWFRGEMSAGLANSVIQLVQDMATGKFSDLWAVVTKAAIAEAILNLTKLDEELRAPEICLTTPTLWLALASLCVLDKDHVERLSSGEWVSSPDTQHGQPRPTCDNHDDNVTSAIILCTECGNLCADCDRYLHLHRRTRTHQRQVFKEEEEAIKVDLHEGCGRTKLFWVMALADSKTLKAMVEFREGKVSSASMGPGTCRFCGATSKTGVLAIGNVCSDPDCQETAKLACSKILPCHHPCGGIKNEEKCLPCLHGCKNGDGEQLKQDADDMCMICFTEALSAAPAIKLKCGHVFHLQCSRTILEKRWVGPRITFGFSLCPICKATIDHPVLKELLDPIRELYDDVKRKALMRLEYEGLHKAEAITTPGARFYKDPAGFSMDRYAYYVCYKCNKAYYGGEARCDEQAGGGEDYDPKELVCGGCSDVSSAQMCPKHGTDFLEYKCRYCCSVAVFFCFGTTHFCNACHDDFQRVTNVPKSELPHCPAGPRCKQLDGDECPLHVQHPVTGEEFALGCGVCRNAHTF